MKKTIKRSFSDQFLDENFPHDWIGRRGHIEWSHTSHDLVPLDFVLCGHLDDLRNRIGNKCRLITREVLSNVRERFEQNLFYCMEVNVAISYFSSHFVIDEHSRGYAVPHERVAVTQMTKAEKLFVPPSNQKLTGPCYISYFHFKVGKSKC